MLASGFAFAAHAARDDMRVERIVDGGSEVASIEVGFKVRLLSPDGRDQSQPLVKGQVVAPGSRLWAGPGLVLELLREEPRLRVRLEPGTRLTIVRNDDGGAALSVEQGRATSSLLSRLDFFYGVGAFKKVLALAHGTVFTVAALPTCEGRSAHPCVTLTLDEGRLSVETRRPLRLGSSAATADDDDSTVLEVDAMAAGETRALALAPEQFALRFDSPAEAERHYEAELESARTAGDSAWVLRALRNLLVVRRMTDRPAAELELAQDGHALAERTGDRLWQFRFLIDEAFALWRLRRDATAFPYFDRAFAMQDVLSQAGARIDLAALYGRYSGVRFDARDRAYPQADLDAAELYGRLALQLREPLPGEPPTLELAKSLYGLGIQSRIGRKDAAHAYAYLSRALQVQREVLQGRDDLATAETMSEAALSLASVIEGGPPACPGADGADVYAPVRALFDESLAIMARLSPARPYRSAAAVARRSADVHRNVGDWLADPCASLAAAAAEWRTARSLYERSLEAWDVQPGSNSAERRFAWRGLAVVQLRARDWDGAARSARQAYAIAIDERCGPTPTPEAPSFKWIADLVELLANARAGAGLTDAEQAGRRIAARWRSAAICPSLAERQLAQ